MTRIDAIEYTEKNNKKFYKVTAEGKTYRAFEESDAFQQLNDTEFKIGDNVDIKSNETQVGEYTYRNLESFTLSTKPIAEPDDTAAMWARKDKRISRQACLKAASRLVASGLIPEALPDVKIFAGDVIEIAKEFEKYVYEGQ